MVEATLFEREDGTARLLHLVNGSGNFGPGVVERVTMHDLEVVLSSEDEPIDVHGLVGGGTLEWRMTDGDLTIRVPELGLFEAIRIRGARSSGKGRHPRSKPRSVSR
jgi:hypothetical protein